MEIEKMNEGFTVTNLDSDEIMSLQSMMLHYAETIYDKEVARKWRHFSMEIDKLLKL